MTPFATTPTAMGGTEPVNFASLGQLAKSLEQEGRAEDALLLSRHLGAVRLGDADTLRQLVRLLARKGKTLEAIEKLVELRAATTDMDALVDEIKRHIPMAIQCFNERLSAGDVALAEKYASALVALVPRNLALLNAALSCNLALGQKDKAAEFAATLLTLDANHETARALLAERAQAPNDAEDAEAEIKAKFDLVLKPKSDIHPLIRLRDMHDVVSAILCRPLSSRAVQQIVQLTNAANELTIDVPAGSEWAGWEKHYRLMFDAIDLSAVLNDTPDTASGKIGCISSTGVALTVANLRETATRLGAETVFFAAADRHYIDLYARWYITSIFKHCDVPFLVILHVIGGARTLGEVANTIGIKDERLIFSGDMFDAEAVKTKCYDTPPKGLIEKPVAHFQSVRFMTLSPLLQILNRPVFVSDIDLLLQRGVKDLLARCAQADVVFNENESSTNAGSRLTANLLLVNPTHQAVLFLRFLKSYLERALSQPEVTRWIDQFALLMARHHLTLKGVDPRIEYFDTTSDINNVMYKSYQQNPFRFLSLYHGFDTSSLEGNPSVWGEEKAEPQHT